jgi:hypothetical protein
MRQELRYGSFERAFAIQLDGQAPVRKQMTA